MNQRIDTKNDNGPAAASRRMGRLSFTRDGLTDLASAIIRRADGGGRERSARTG